MATTSFGSVRDPREQGIRRPRGTPMLPAVWSSMATEVGYDAYSLLESSSSQGTYTVAFAPEGSAPCGEGIDCSGKPA